MPRWPKVFLSIAAVSLNLGCGTLALTAAPMPTLTPVPAANSSIPPVLTTAPLVASATPILWGAEFSDTSFALPLTIRHVTETAVDLYFELSQPARGVVLISDDTAAHDVVAVTEFDDQSVGHSVTVENLAAGKSYRVEVGIASAQGYDAPAYRGHVWGPVTFATASNVEPVRVAVIGDAGMGDKITPSLDEQMTAYNPNFVIFVGDTVYNVPDNRDPYEAFALKYYEPLAALLQTRPVYNVVGNHDVEAATVYQGMPFYYRAFPPFSDPRFDPSDLEGRNQWYAFAYGNIQFLMLDSQTFYNEDGHDAQAAWLQERLADSRFSYTIPAFHIPPFTSGKHTFDGLGVRQEWVPLFEGAHVPLVLSGHDHNYERLESNGITYLVSGGGSASLYDLKSTLPESRFFVKQSNFVIVDFYPDRIEVQAIALGGAVLDTATIPIR
jgi:calcineurin-like phosphoesterase family protein